MKLQGVFLLGCLMVINMYSQPFLLKEIDISSGGTGQRMLLGVYDECRYEW